MSATMPLRFHNNFLLTFLWLLLCSLIVSKGTETDIRCLKSIKDSLEDPRGNLDSSWNFDNNTEGFICKFKGVSCWHNDENKVLALNLSAMGLKGKFPLGIHYCKYSLSSLDLSSNELSGPLPSNISHVIAYVTSLDLSSNKFSGEIPVEIANLSFLNFLKLDNNQLTGLIPPQIGLMERLKDFSVSNNLLTGPVPKKFPTGSFIRSESYANNSGLCGEPLEPCEGHTKILDSPFQRGFVIGYVVSFVSVVVVFVSYCVPWVYDRNRNKMMTITNIILMLLIKKKKQRLGKVRGWPSAELMQEESREISSLEERVTRMNYADLSDATNNFRENNVIGMGKMGTMYKATLPNGYLLAVKKLHDSPFLEEQFISELKTLGTLRHVNLLPLLGFCIESKQRFLVYKYMPNGRLYNWLHPMEGQAKVMEWPLRVKTAIGLAKGLAWLHQDCNIRIIHLDISSKCILLDHNFEPKLSNFGEAMLISSTSTSFVNSEFWGTAFVKEDVHSFGIVLLELITGMDFCEMINSSNSYTQIVNEWVSHLLNNASVFYDAVDKSLIGQGFDSEISQLLKVAYTCVHYIPDQRPTMLQVYNDIKPLGERYGFMDYSKTLV